MFIPRVKSQISYDKTKIKGSLKIYFADYTAKRAFSQ